MKKYPYIRIYNKDISEYFLYNKDFSEYFLCMDIMGYIKELIRIK